MAGRAHKWNFISALLPARLGSSNTWPRPTASPPSRQQRLLLSCTAGHANHFIAFICVHFAIVRLPGMPMAKDAPFGSQSNPI